METTADPQGPVEGTGKPGPDLLSLLAYPLFLAVAGILAWLLYEPPPAPPEPRFRRVADFQPGPPGRSAGAAWGDLNSDGRPDLLLGTRDGPPSILLNTATKREVSFEPLEVPGPGSTPWSDIDLRSGQWADVDNDGDQDLFLTVGSARRAWNGSNLLLVNEGGDLGYPPGRPLARAGARGSASAFLDVDADGWLDAILAASGNIAGGPATAVHRQASRALSFQGAAVGGLPDSLTSRLVTLADLNGDDRPEVILAGVSGRGLAVYDTGPEPFRDLSGSLGRRALPAMRDLAAQDFNGDLRAEILGVRYRTGSDVHRHGARRLSALLMADGSEVGLEFVTEGPVTLHLAGAAAPNGEALHSRLRLGRDGPAPAGPTVRLALGPEVVGISPHAPGEDVGVYLSADPDTERWTLLFSSPTRRRLEVTVESDATLEEVEPVGFEDYRPETDPVYLVRQGQRLYDMTTVAGLTTPVASTSLAAADFDNDMDLDLWIVNRTPAGNAPDVWYENRGGGTFVPHPILPDDPVVLGGVGDGVALADFDLDGFVDAVTTNGGASVAAAGPAILYHNTGNENHWLELDLVGTASNRDAVGAVVLLRTPDGRTQYRLQDGGTHGGGQNFQRIHFGLADHGSASFEIRWPGGSVQRVPFVRADQIVTVVEEVGGGPR